MRGQKIEYSAVRCRIVSCFTQALWRQAGEIKEAVCPIRLSQHPAQRDESESGIIIIQIFTFSENCNVPYLGYKGNNKVPC